MTNINFFAILVIVGVTMERQEKIDIIKHHLNNVISEEQPKYQHVPEVFIYDRNEFFKDSLLSRLNKKMKLIPNSPPFEKILNYTGDLEVPKYYTYSMAGGFTNGKNITILMNDKTFKNDFNEELYFKILSTFHEYRHVCQIENFDIKNIDKPITNFNHFQYLIEHNCKRYLPPGYALAHDDFYFEIDANLYGIEMADQYCQKNNISAGKFQQTYKQRQYSKQLTYNFDNFIAMNRSISINPLVSNKLQKNPTYSLFFNKFGNFNKLSDIIKNPLFFSLGERLKMEMLTSENFISSINYNLNDIESNYLMKLVDNKMKFLVNNYNKNREFFEQNIFDYNTFINNSANLLSRMEYLLNFKLKDAKGNDNKDLYYVNYEQQIQNIRSICSFGNKDNLVYGDKESLNKQLNNIISTFNNFFADSNNLLDMQRFFSTVKLLQEAILAKIDISSIATVADYEQITSEYKNVKRVQNMMPTQPAQEMPVTEISQMTNSSVSVPVQSSNLDMTDNSQQPIYQNTNNNEKAIHDNISNYSYSFSPQNNVEIPQIDSSKIRKRIKGNISYDLIFFVNMLLSILVTIGYLFILYN